MNPDILDQLTPEGRETIIKLEARLRELEEQIAEIDARLDYLNKLDGGNDGVSWI